MVRERIILPEEGNAGKFIQLIIRGIPFIRSGGLDRYHADIFRDALKEFDLPIQEVDVGEVETRPINEKEGLYSLVGAGKVDVTSEKAVFYGVSSDYEVKTNGEHLSQIQQYCPEIKLVEGRLTNER